MKPSAEKRFWVSSKTIVSAAICAALCATSVVDASPLYSGTITGTFTAPILSGNLIETDGSVSFLDNSASQFLTYSGEGTPTFNWGNYDGGTPPLPPNVPDHSTLQFLGLDFTNRAPDEVFKLGTLTFTNGTSFVDTIVFGITLTIGVVDFNVAIDPAVTQVGILTTLNGDVDPFRDADFVSFDVLPLTFHVFEGATATADLFGYIHGDPQVVISGISLPPGQPGFLAPVPEPGTYALILTGLALLGLVARRQRRKIAFQGNLARARGQANPG